jgi:hypothetical protein
MFPWACRFLPPFDRSSFLNYRHDYGWRQLLVVDTVRLTELVCQQWVSCVCVCVCVCVCARARVCVRARARARSFVRRVCYMQSLPSLPAVNHEQRASRLRNTRENSSPRFVSGLLWRKGGQNVKAKIRSKKCRSRESLEMHSVSLCACIFWYLGIDKLVLNFARYSVHFHRGHRQVQELRESKKSWVAVLSVKVWRRANCNGEGGTAAASALPTTRNDKNRYNRNCTWKHVTFCIYTFTIYCISENVEQSRHFAFCLCLYVSW